MLKVEIDRAKWDRGEGSEGELLVNRLSKYGCRCALGFVALACGIADDAIVGVGDPSDDIDAEDHGWPDSIVRVETVKDDDGYDMFSASLTDVGAGIMYTNDSRAYDDDADREARIVALGREAGIEFTFVGEGKP